MTREQTSGCFPLEGERKPEPFLNTPFSEQNAEFSPDGRWIAYVSDETGRREIYVTPYPGPGGKFLISKDGGVEPLWAPDGTEIFYRTRTTLGAGRSDHKSDGGSCPIGTGVQLG